MVVSVATQVHMGFPKRNAEGTGSTTFAGAGLTNNNTQTT